MRSIDLISTSLVAALVAVCLNCSDAQATGKTNVRESVKVSRTYNYNWQSEIVAKYPNSKNFNWTPIILTRASKSAVASHARKPFHYQKPNVVASVVRLNKHSPDELSKSDNASYFSVSSTTTASDKAVNLTTAVNSTGACLSYDSNNSGYHSNIAATVKPAVNSSSRTTQSVSGRVVQVTSY
ncbi:MAG: hypothetical protein Q8T09_11280 [Candidatus Melainabacteria bacterium]|nr:hypothetical protein [Candidatus Melainabacteria bacterium]